MNNFLKRIPDILFITGALLAVAGAATVITVIVTSEIYASQEPKVDTSFSDIHAVMDLSNDIVDAKLDDLEETQYWSHTNSDNCTFECRTLELLDMEPVHGAWENLYHGRCDIDNAYKQWENSPKHKEVLEKDSDFEILRYRKMDDGKCYIVLFKVQLDK